jgi:hypothetical protein
MRRWQVTALIVGAAALFLAARPAQAQVWVGPPMRPVPPVGVVPPVWGGPPVGVVPGPVVVSPGWGARRYWRGRPYWGAWRAYRPVARRWYW